MLYRPAPLILENAFYDALIAIDLATEPLADEEIVLGILRMAMAQFTNNASPDVLMKMIAAVGGPKTPEEILSRAHEARERAMMPFPH